MDKDNHDKSTAQMSTEMSEHSHDQHNALDWCCKNEPGKCCASAVEINGSSCEHNNPRECCDKATGKKRICCVRSNVKECCTPSHRADLKYCCKMPNAKCCHDATGKKCSTKIHKGNECCNMMEGFTKECCMMTQNKCCGSIRKDGTDTDKQLHGRHTKMTYCPATHGNISLADCCAQSNVKCCSQFSSNPCDAHVNTNECCHSSGRPCCHKGGTDAAKTH